MVMHSGCECENRRRGRVCEGCDGAEGPGYNTARGTGALLTVRIRCVGKAEQAGRDAGG